jgi:hypothetical protein
MNVGAAAKKLSPSRFALDPDRYFAAFREFSTSQWINFLK